MRRFSSLFFVLAGALLLAIGCGDDSASGISGDDGGTGNSPFTGECPIGEVDCGDFCANLRMDPLNCGQCLRSCGPAETCVDGACQPAVGTGGAPGAGGVPGGALCDAAECFS